MRTVLFALVCSIFGGVAGHAQAVTFKNPPEMAKPNGYSQVVIVRHGTSILISGQVGLNSQGEMASDFPGQVKQAFGNIRTALTAVGATPAHLVKLNYYVVGLNHERLLAIRDARDNIIDKEHPPASTLVGVQTLFRDDALIEIEAEAVLP